LNASILSRIKGLVSDFVAYLPQSGAPISIDALVRNLNFRGLLCHAEPGVNGQIIIVFEASSDVLYLDQSGGLISYLEHSPDYSTKPRLSGHIADTLTALGCEWIDEDDPRWRAAE
jgi:hypothetical protein